MASRALFTSKARAAGSPAGKLGFGEHRLITTHQGLLHLGGKTGAMHGVKARSTGGIAQGANGKAALRWRQGSVGPWRISRGRGPTSRSA
jgi:hypothetical protein